MVKQNVVYFFIVLFVTFFVVIGWIPINILWNNNGNDCGKIILPNNNNNHNNNHDNTNFTGCDKIIVANVNDEKYRPLWIQNTVNETSKNNLIAVMVVAVEGSGSTLLFTALSKMKEVKPLKQWFYGEFVDPLDLEINGALQSLFKYSGSVSEVMEARKFLKDKLSLMYSNCKSKSKSHIVMHFSYPDLKNEIVPDISPWLFDLFYQSGFDLHIVVAFRNPIETAFSTYRRRFPHVCDVQNVDDDEVEDVETDDAGEDNIVHEDKDAIVVVDGVSRNKHNKKNIGNNNNNYDENSKNVILKPNWKKAILSAQRNLFMLNSQLANLDERSYFTVPYHILTSKSTIPSNDGEFEGQHLFKQMMAFLKLSSSQKIALAVSDDDDDDDGGGGGGGGDDDDDDDDGDGFDQLGDDKEKENHGNFQKKKKRNGKMFSASKRKSSLDSNLHAITNEDIEYASTIFTKQTLSSLQPIAKFAQLDSQQMNWIHQSPTPNIIINHNNISSSFSSSSSSSSLYNKKRIKVCLTIPSTTRNTEIKSVDFNIPFFQSFLPSFIKTIDNTDEKFIYTIYFGYDSDDEIYSTPQSKEKFLKLIKRPSLAQKKLYGNIYPTHMFSIVPVDLGISSCLVEVFNKLAARAYDDDCAYIAQVNDDVEFLSRGWVDSFVTLLKDKNPWKISNFGVVGWRDIFNPVILTMNMVHRSHLDVFGRNKYFDPQFCNWGTDVWISKVYGAASFSMVEHPIRNKQSYGTRYTPVKAQKKLLLSSVCEGRNLLYSHLQNGLQAQLSSLNQTLIGQMKEGKKTKFQVARIMKYTTTKHTRFAKSFWAYSNKIDGNFACLS